LSRRKSVRFVGRFVILAIAVGALAAYTSYSKRSMRAYAAASDEPTVPQMANREAKTDRLARFVTASLTTIEPEATYSLASTPPAARPIPAADALAMATPIPPKEELAPHPAPAPAAPKHAAVTPPSHEPTPHEKPKTKPPAPAAAGILDDNQISGLKGRLRLTADQAEYWPAVEEALRDVVRTQLHGHNLLRGGKPNIDVNSPEVQKLIWAAMPLLMRLREDQKGEVRKLARIIGLEQVASQI
jgi:hypothetical protein